MPIADRKEARTYFTQIQDRVTVTYRSDPTPDGIQARGEFRTLMQALIDQPLLQCADTPQGFDSMSVTRFEGRWIVKIDALVQKLRRDK